MSICPYRNLCPVTSQGNVSLRKILITGRLLNPDSFYSTLVMKDGSSETYYNIFSSIFSTCIHNLQHKVMFLLIELHRTSLQDDSRVAHGFVWTSCSRVQSAHVTMSLNLEKWMTFQRSPWNLICK